MVMIRQQAPRALPTVLLLSSLPARRRWWRWWGNRHFLVGGSFSSGGRRCLFCCARTAGAAAGRMGDVSGDGVATALAGKAAKAAAMVVGDPASLERKKAAIRHRGPDNLQVIADFDGTLTRYWIDGCRGQTSHSLLKSNPETDAKIQAQYEYYHPLEYSPAIPIDEKTELMEEWWEKTHSLLIEGGLTYDDIQKSVSSANIAFRDGVIELFEFLEEKDVPVLVFSAGVADVIEEVFRQKLHRSFRNIKVVSNRMVFDNGRLVAFKGKTIHVLNKNEHALDMAAPVHDQLGDSNGSSDNNTSVKKRTNVLLLGDHTGDLGMSDGLNYENRISIGFLNDNIEKSLETYQEAFDMVLLNDASMYGVLELVSQLCSPNKR